MKLKMDLYKNYIILALISLIFVCVNIMTFSSTLPWCDEVILTETSTNYVDYGDWVSRASGNTANYPPFSMYVPLPQMAHVVWMYIFGTGIVGARTFNLFVYFLIGVVLLFLIEKKQGSKLNLMQATLFFILLWGIGGMIDIYRNGRGDLFGCLMCLLLLVAVIAYIQNTKKKELWIILILSIALFWSGIQCCVLAFFAMFFYWIVDKTNRKKTFRMSLVMILGFIVGLITVLAFFQYHNHLIAFLSWFVGSSGTLRGYTLKLLPYIGPIIGVDADSILQRAGSDMGISSGSEFFLRVLSILKDPSYIILLITAVIVCVVDILNDKGKRHNNLILLLLIFDLLIPFFMNLAGKYVWYYTWMSYLPLIVAVTLGYSTLTRKTYLVIMACPVVLLLVLSYSHIYNRENAEEYLEVSEMCNRIPFEKNDLVSAPDQFFYILKEKTDYSYYTERYPVEYINMPELKYHIVDKTRKYYNINKVISADSTIILVPIDSCCNSKIVAYKLSK